MKKSFNFLLIIILISVTVYGQQGNYYPIPNSNVYWNETAFWTVWLPAPTPVYDDYTLFVSGDTTIGIHDYHKLYQSGEITSVSPPVIYYSNQYIGAFRQDTMLQLVYIIPGLDTTEQLLYDFSLDTGDTLAPAYNNDVFNPNYNGNYVLAVDSVMVGTEYHKRMLLNPITNGSGIPDTTYAIIEGIGSTFGFYHLIEPPFETGSQLVCFSHDSIYYPPVASCPFYLGTEETGLSNSKISLWPNPGTDRIILSSDKFIENGQILIYSQLGNLVKLQQNISGNSIAIQKDGLPDGMYFISLHENGAMRWSGKVVFN